MKSSSFCALIRALSDDYKCFIGILILTNQSTTDSIKEQNEPPRVTIPRQSTVNIGSGRANVQGCHRRQACLHNSSDRTRERWIADEALRLQLDSVKRTSGRRPSNGQPRTDLPRAANLARQPGKILLLLIHSDASLSSGFPVRLLPASCAPGSCQPVSSAC